MLNNCDKLNENRQPLTETRAGAATNGRLIDGNGGYASRSEFGKIPNRADLPETELLRQDPYSLAAISVLES